MEQLMVISAVGGEPTAVVQEVTRVIMDCGGNIKESNLVNMPCVSIENACRYVGLIM